MLKTAGLLFKCVLISTVAFISIVVLSSIVATHFDSRHSQKNIFRLVVVLRAFRKLECLPLQVRLLPACRGSNCSTVSYIALQQRKSRHQTVQFLYILKGTNHVFNHVLIVYHFINEPVPTLFFFSLSPSLGSSSGYCGRGN